MVKLKFLSLSVLLLVGACSKDSPAPLDAASLDYQKQLQTQLITAKPGDVIVVPAGVHPINRGLSLNVSGVTIRGEGMDKSILSFKDQIQGAEGLLVSASDFTIEDLAIEDTAGDALKINEGSNIVIRREITATSVVPPPISTIMFAVGSVIGNPAPIAAAIGSSIK